MPFTYTKNEDGLFVCPDCGVTKANQNTMHYHMKKHLEEPNHVCKSCKKGFLQKQALELHIRSKHTEKGAEIQSKITCTFPNCKFTSLTKSNATIHFIRMHFNEEANKIMLIDNDTKKITCIQCDKEFKSSCSFFYHSQQCIPFDKKSDKYKTFTKLAV
jgi:transcription elongation factor Elf1